MVKRVQRRCTVTQTLESEATRVAPEAAPARAEPREPRSYRAVVALVLAAIVVAVGILMYADEAAAPVLETGDYVTTGVRYVPQLDTGDYVTTGVTFVPRPEFEVAQTLGL